MNLWRTSTLSIFFYLTWSWLANSWIISHGDATSAWKTQREKQDAQLWFPNASLDHRSRLFWHLCNFRFTDRQGFKVTTPHPYYSSIKQHQYPCHPWSSCTRTPCKAQSWAQPRWHLGFEAQEFFVLNVIGSFCASMTLMTLTIWETISCLEWEAIPQIRSCHKEDDISFLTCTFPATDSLRSPPNG